MSDEERDDNKYLSIFDNNCVQFDEQIMSLESVTEFKKMEAAMVDRTEKGYYRCKVKHEALYNECLAAYAKYCTPTMLAMLQHNFSTQKNEALNHAVATIAPKTKDFSKSNSLRTRVMLTGAAQIVGHLELWSRIFKKLEVEMDENLIKHLKGKDNKKAKRQEQQKTKKYKASRSSNRYDKFSEAHRDQLEEMKTGAMYESGVAVKVAKKSLKEAPKRNPEGTKLEEWKCPYFHKNYCVKQGHKDCRSIDCCMFGKSKEDRDKVSKEIEKEAIAIAVNSKAIEGKSNTDLLVNNLFDRYVLT